MRLRKGDLVLVSNKSPFRGFKIVRHPNPHKNGMVEMIQRGSVDCLERKELVKFALPREQVKFHKYI